MRAKTTSTEATERLSVSVEEAAGMLGVGRSSIFNLLNEGALASVKIGKRRLIPVVELRAFLERQVQRAS